MIDHSNNKKIFFALVIFVFTFITRYLFAEHNFYDADTVGFALGSISYSLEQTRPHMPGYFLHVEIIRLLNSIASSPHLSAQILSFLYSSLGALLAYIFLLKYFEKKNAALTAFVLITNPLVWYFGSTTDIYIFDLLFSSAFILLGLSARWIYYLPVFTAVAMGIRPSSGVFLFPLYCYLWYSNYKKNGVNKRFFIISHMVSVLAALFWFVPMALSTGSISNYLRLFNTNSPMSRISTLQNIYQFTSYLFWFAFPLLLIILYLVLRGRIKESYKIVRGFYSTNKSLLFWIIPLIVVFIFYNYAKGWLIIIALPMIMWTGVLRDHKILSQSFLLIVIVVQMLVFILFPKMENKIEGWFIFEYRNANLFTTWYYRTFSVYSMTYSKINEQDKVLSNLRELILSIKKMPGYGSKAIFLDPVNYTYARALQLIYPNSKFITLDFDRSNGFIEYYQNNIERKDGFKKAITNSILITDSSFYSKYLKDEGSSLSFSNYGFTYLNVSDDNIDKVNSIYNKYFVRSKK